MTIVRVVNNKIIIINNRTPDVIENSPQDPGCPRKLAAGPRMSQKTRRRTQACPRKRPEKKKEKSQQKKLEKTTNNKANLKLEYTKRAKKGEKVHPDNLTNISKIFHTNNL